MFKEVKLWLMQKQLRKIWECKKNLNKLTWLENSIEV